MYGWNTTSSVLLRTEVLPSFSCCSARDVRGSSFESAIRGFCLAKVCVPGVPVVAMPAHSVERLPLAGTAQIAFGQSSPIRSG